MKKKVISLLLALFVVFSTPAVVNSADFDPSIRNSVAVVNTCFDISGQAFSFGWGTGFFVGELEENPMYLITNYHVIEPFIVYGAGELLDIDTDAGVLTGRSKIRVYYSSSDFEEAYPVAYDQTKDIAVLKLSSPTGKRQALALRSPTDDMVGSEVYAIGFPGLAENIFADATSVWGSSDVSVTSGSFSRMLTTSGTGQSLIQIDCVIRHGNSGGPVVNGDGEAIGVAVSVVSDDSSQVYYAVNIDEIVPYLRQYDIPYVANADKGFFSGTTLIIIIAGVVVLAMAGIIIFLIVHKKKPSKPLPNPNMMAGPVPEPVPQKMPVLRSLSQQHSGMRIPLQGRQILIGTSRNDCELVFQPGTPGVSRRHCSISWDPSTGDFILTDLGSSYGTFLENKKRLAQGVPARLRPGDRFYLGSPENLLTTGLE